VDQVKPSTGPSGAERANEPVTGGAKRFLRVYAAWIVLVTAVVLVAAFAVTSHMKAQYQSTARVVVEAQVFANTTPVPPDMGSEKLVAESGLVLDTAAKKLGVDPGVLGTGLAVSVSPDTNVLEFDYTSGRPGVARARAQEIAAAYVAYRNASSSSSQKPSATTPRIPVKATMVTPASLPSAPKGHPLEINLAVGLAIGLLLGLGTAIIRDWTSDRLRSRAEVEHLAGVPVLATVPRAGWLPRRPGPPVLYDNASPQAEAFRYLRARIEAVGTPVVDGRIVLVASAASREGRTTVAVNIAAALAASGAEVLLVDGDMRHPRLHEVFGIIGGDGLTDVLAEPGFHEPAVRSTSVHGLRVLTAGSELADPGDLLEGRRLRNLFLTLRYKADYVIIDSAPLLDFADPVALASACDDVLLVADVRRTTRTGLAAAERELAGLDTTVGGAVLNSTTRAFGVRAPRSGVPATRRAPATEPVDVEQT
jgi:capsular exopolysaccharide synthesis family protein